MIVGAFACGFGNSVTIQENEGFGVEPCQAFARMVEAVGCDNVHLRCNATDLDFVNAQVANARFLQ